MGCAALSLTTARLATAGRVVAVHMIVVVAESKTSRGPVSVRPTTTRSSLSLLGHCFLFSSPFLLGSSFLALWAILFFTATLFFVLARRTKPKAAASFAGAGPPNVSITFSPASIKPRSSDILTHAPSITSPDLSPRTRRLDLSLSSVGITNASRTLDGNVPPSASARKPSASDGSHPDSTDDSDVRIIVNFGGRLKLTILVAVTRGPSPRHVQSR